MQIICKECQSPVKQTSCQKKKYCNKICKAKWHNRLQYPRQKILKEILKETNPRAYAELMESQKARVKDWMIRNVERVKSYQTERDIKASATLSLLREFSDSPKKSRKEKPYNKEKQKQCNQSWRLRNPEKQLEYNRRYKAKRTATVKIFREMNIL